MYAISFFLFLISHDFDLEFLFFFVAKITNSAISEFKDSASQFIKLAKEEIAAQKEKKLNLVDKKEGDQPQNPEQEPQKQPAQNASPIQQQKQPEIIKNGFQGGQSFWESKALLQVLLCNIIFLNVCFLYLIFFN